MRDERKLVFLILYYSFSCSNTAGSINTVLAMRKLHFLFIKLKAFSWTFLSIKQKHQYSAILRQDHFFYGVHEISEELWAATFACHIQKLHYSCKTHFPRLRASYIAIFFFSLSMWLLLWNLSRDHVSNNFVEEILKTILTHTLTW